MHTDHSDDFSLGSSKQSDENNEDSSNLRFNEALMKSSLIDEANAAPAALAIMKKEAEAPQVSKCA
jgi:hypothetical protein